jgi:hypothetical protein
MDMQKSSSRANDSASASADFWVRSQKNPRLHAVAVPIQRQRRHEYIVREYLDILDARKEHHHE